MKIYGDIESGNCLKVKWAADYLGLPYSWVPIDIMKGETRTPAFYAMNPTGQTPVLETDGKYLGQSNAIIRYLARGSSLLPDDAWTQAKIDEWLFWEQYSHEPNIATSRFHMHYLKKSKESRDLGKVERGEKSLDQMERHLTNHTFLVGATPTIADVALLAYTRVAHEGGFDLSTRPHLRAWITRSETALKLPRTGF